MNINNSSDLKSFEIEEAAEDWGERTLKAKEATRKKKELKEITNAIKANARSLVKTLVAERGKLESGTGVDHAKLLGLYNEMIKLTKNFDLPCSELMIKTLIEIRDGKYPLSNFSPSQQNVLRALTERGLINEPPIPAISASGKRILEGVLPAAI